MSRALDLLAGCAIGAALCYVIRELISVRDEVWGENTPADRMRAIQSKLYELAAVTFTILLGTLTMWITHR